MSISIRQAREMYGGESEAEVVSNLAKCGGYRRIYKYANDYGDKVTHTNYKCIQIPGDSQERALLSSPLAHNVVLVYDEGKLIPQQEAKKPETAPEAGQNEEVLIEEWISRASILDWLRRKKRQPPPSKDCTTQAAAVLWKRFDELGPLVDPKLGVEVLTDILNTDFDDADAHFKIAYLYYNNSTMFGDRLSVRSKTMEHLNCAIALEPAHVAALFLRGVVRMDYRDRTGAVSDWQSVIAVDSRCGHADMARNALVDLGINL